MKKLILLLIVWLTGCGIVVPPPPTGIVIATTTLFVTDTPTAVPTIALDPTPEVTVIPSPTPEFFLYEGFVPSAIRQIDFLTAWCHEQNTQRRVYQHLFIVITDFVRERECLAEYGK